MPLQRLHNRRLYRVVALIVISVSTAGNHDSASVAAAQVSDSNSNKTVDVVYIGDSITLGSEIPAPSTQAPPAVCTDLLREHLPGISVFMSNQGEDGHTTVDALPSSNLDFPIIERAATRLQKEHPGLLIFSIMLGTNDSAESGTNGAPVSAKQYGENLRTIISRLLLEYPGSIAIVNRPTWYSPNTHNDAVYDKPGLARLQTYFPVIESTVHSFSSTPGRVYEGDTAAFDFFATHSQTDLTPEQGREGTFYLHPNVQGAQALGRFWSFAIVHALELHDR